VVFYAELSDNNPALDANALARRIVRYTEQQQTNQAGKYASNWRTG
jgi:hypothetical protein